ncbi:MAG: DUF6607 family protein [Pseudomonadota bacterium]
MTSKSLFLALLLTVPAASVFANSAEEENVEPIDRQYTFSWNFVDQSTMAPRGGTTKGPAVTLDTEPSEAWENLQDPGITKKERDRRAILAMAGAYRTSFDFLETVGYTAGYQPKRPYQSWGTEYVYVVEDKPEFVSLQHIIVMFFVDQEGAVQGPAVVKHWRQDWQYEDRALHVYDGHQRFRKTTLTAEEAAGTWSQSVYQVDDSPRYQAYGRWEHTPSYSSWLSSKTWRPLPRREFSVRDDYHVLEGTNRHTITRNGWVQEENNLKLVLTEDGSPNPEQPYLAREQGMARYERIVDHDFSSGDEYWKTTGPFWADVRQVWNELFEQHESFHVPKKLDDQSLFMVMFQYAGGISADAPYDAEASLSFVRNTLAKWVDPSETAKPAQAAAY